MVPQHTDSIQTPTPRPVKPPPAHVSDEAAANIPAELREQARWLDWRWHLPEGEVKWKKPPINPRTGSHVNGHDPRNWLTFEEARGLAPEHGDGIGCQLPPGLVGFDL